MNPQEPREPIRCQFGGRPLPLIGPGWNHTPEVRMTRDLWARVYQRWLKQTGTQGSVQAAIAFHDVAPEMLHNHCNFCP